MGEHRDRACERRQVWESTRTNRVDDIDEELDEITRDVAPEDVLGEIEEDQPQPN
jgi:hypothetical protein